MQPGKSSNVFMQTISKSKFAKSTLEERKNNKLLLPTDYDHMTLAAIGKSCFEIESANSGHVEKNNVKKMIIAVEPGQNAPGVHIAVQMERPRKWTSVHQEFKKFGLYGYMTGGHRNGFETVASYLTQATNKKPLNKLDRNAVIVGFDLDELVMKKKMFAQRCQ